MYRQLHFNHLLRCLDTFQAEQGCIRYQLYKEAGGQSGSYAMIETWATQVVIIIVIVILETNPENKKAKQKQQTKEQTNATKKREAGHLGSYAMIENWATQVNQLLLLLLLFLFLEQIKQKQEKKKKQPTKKQINATKRSGGRSVRWDTQKSNKQSLGGRIQSWAI